MSLSSSAVLVDLSLYVWTANKTDKSETSKLNTSSGAIRNAAKVKKNLMAGTSLIKDVINFSATCRNWHHSVTTPWSTRGARLLATSYFLDYKEEANKKRARFEQLVTEVIADYPNLLQTAETNLGSLHNTSDYPPLDELRQKFGFSLVFSPVPESGDFRVDVGTKELEELKEQYKADFNNRLQEAMKEPWERLYKSLIHISERLEESGGEDKKRYFESLITNAQELCGMLSHLNVLKDPQLEAAKCEVERALTGVDIADIRSSSFARITTKKKVDEILNKFEW